MTDQEQHIGTGGTGYQSAGNMTVNNVSVKNKSIIAEVVNEVSKLEFEYKINRQDNVELPANIKNKIEHNNVVKCRHIIEAIKTNNIDLNNAYDVLEQEKPGKKQKLLKIIRSMYEQELGALAKQKDNLTQEDIRMNADRIIENMVSNLRVRVLESSNLDAANEDVDLTIQLIVSDAFISCIVLENPEAAI